MLLEITCSDHGWVVRNGETEIARYDGQRDAIRHAQRLLGHPADFAAPPGLRVLAAEDNQINRLVLRALLEQRGIDPTFVGNGLEALEAWRRQEWDLILMDVQMPGMDGVSATRAVRVEESESERRRTSIVAITANTMEHELRAYRAAGMDAVLAKPIDAHELLRAIHQAERAAQLARSSPCPHHAGAGK